MKHVLPILLLLCLGLAGCWSGEHGQAVMSSFAIQANSNDMATVQKEIDSPAFRALLAHAAVIGEWQVRRLRISLDDGGASWKSAEAVGRPVADCLSSYLSCRAEGHSPAYCSDVMARGKASRSAEHRFLNDIPEKEGFIPERWITRFVPGTNAMGRRFIGFVVVDGQLAWSYALSYRQDGQFESCFSSRRDAVEFDPNCTNLIAEVEALVEQKMKAEGSHGQFGSCHRFWQLKQEMLKGRGIQWHSPSELNPNICYE